MIGQHTLKRFLKRTAGRAAVVMEPLTYRPAYLRACIFFYHRVADIGFIDPHLDDWNVPPSTFERQIASLAEFADVVALLDLPARLKSASPVTKPLVALTFDDGYANFYTQVLPVLKRYRIPATLFVITSMIGRTEPMPFDRWSQRNRNRVSGEAWRPISWPELEACLDSGIISIGSHSHYHLKGSDCTRAVVVEEAERSNEFLRARLGQSQALAYSYPYGNTRLGHVSPEYVTAVRTAGYKLAVTTNLGLASPDSDPYLLPRVEAHALDASAVLRAKALGVLAPYHLAYGLRITNNFV
jgi:peptidoglycan/xylan/chitin deacetylase (PgdA/CDA1 family)